MIHHPQVEGRSKTFSWKVTYWMCSWVSSCPPTQPVGGSTTKNSLKPLGTKWSYALRCPSFAEKLFFCEKKRVYESYCEATHLLRSAFLPSKRTHAETIKGLPTSKPHKNPKKLNPRKKKKKMKTQKNTLSSTKKISKQILKTKTNTKNQPKSC